ncbi:helix-turn-helix domain-containing protein [Streptomyces hygroscopicus]|uniref:helix-turn-helix domain-containing protein n=1 Tax=Streptomyces hygroscopicus TaxID=1912 RepID=UPI001FCA59D6|nr:helix-turn-helix domain containing protein [Streptomyces hygroscopicus]BDH10539.1 hypothetical protein HOK021_17180 [Streptomyces hygroscopicus]
MGISRMKSKSPRLSANARTQQALELRSQYEAGATVRELKELSGLSHGTVLSRLQAVDTTMRTPYESRQLRADAKKVAARRRLASSLRTRYESGLTVHDLAAYCERSTRTVRRLLDEAGATLRSPHETRQLKQATARQQLMTALRVRYEAGEKVPALADAYGCSESKVYRLLRKAGATMRLRLQTGSARPDRPP